MLLRSSSAPISNSWLPHSKDSSSSPEREPLLHLPRTKSISLTCSFHSSSPSSPTHDPSKKPFQVQHISKSKSLPRPKRKSPTSKIKAKEPENDEEKDEKGKLKNDVESSTTIERLFSSSGLGERVMSEEGRCVEKKDQVLQTLVVGGGVGSNGGRICGGGGGGRGSGGGDGGDGGGGSGFSEGNNNRGSDSTDAYYQKMIEANPGNGLLLGNYAKFLKEVKKRRRRLI